MPLRILHIINKLSLGGAEALLSRLATRDLVNTHIVVSLGGPAWYSARLQDAGVPVHHLEIERISAIGTGAVRLDRIIRESGADVVQCWMYRSNVFGGAIAKRAGKSVVWGIHCSSLEPLSLRSRMLARLGGILAPWIPAFIINCSTASAQLHAKLGYSRAPGAVIHNGYDSSIWCIDECARSAARGAVGVSDTDFLVGSIARWHAQKDIPNLLAALGIVREKGIPFRCLLVGVGLDDRNGALAAAVHKARCSDVVVALGPRADMQDIARALDFHVLASCGAEAFPNVVAETMLSGTPNAVTNVGDTAIMLGSTGWIVPPSDPQRLAEAIVEAYQEWKERRAEWAERRRAARDQIARHFSFQRMLAAYTQVWREVARSTHVTRRAGADGQPGPTSDATSPQSIPAKSGS